MPRRNRGEKERDIRQLAEELMAVSLSGIKAEHDVKELYQKRTGITAAQVREDVRIAEAYFMTPKTSEQIEQAIRKYKRSFQQVVVQCAKDRSIEKKPRAKIIEHPDGTRTNEIMKESVTIPANYDRVMTALIQLMKLDGLHDAPIDASKNEDRRRTAETLVAGLMDAAGKYPKPDQK